METSNPDNKIYFPGDVAGIISNILKKYSLEETDEELAKKIFSEDDNPFIIRGGFILETAISLAKKEITEKVAIALLQKELNISHAIAEGLIEEMKIKIVSLATSKKPVVEKIKNESSQIIEVEDREHTNISPNIKTTTSANTAMESIEKNIPQTVGEMKNGATIPYPRKENSTATEEIKKSVPQQRQSKGSDSYREPIE